jgi:subtilase family serine protease
MRSWKFVLPLLASSLCFAAQPDRIPGPIDSTQMVPLKGNVHGLVQTRVDLGRTDGSQIIHEVTLVFHPSTAQQADLDNLLAQQQDRSSPNYHRWLTPAQFADRFGMSQGDITRIVSWLESQGLTVTSVANSRNQISFDGTVAQVESVFATEIHNYLVDGVIHFANATNPSVPAALAESVLSIGHLHDFSPKPRAIVRRIPSEGADPHFTSAVSGDHFLSPGDFATIYDVQPLYTAGIDGNGQSIAIIGQSTVSATDLSNFRSAAGLAAKAPQYVLVPSTSAATRCTGDETESDLDLEWSGGVAKNANIIFVYAGLVSGDTCSKRSNSVWDALQYAVDNNEAPVISTSYGFCESGLGQSFVDTVQTWAQQANSQGQTILAASGDAGAADCDDTGAKSASGGLAVDIPAAIPEVTGMGGTEFFGDPSSTSTTTYWNATGSSDDISSAISYIPEEGWNDTAEEDGLTASGGGASIYFTKPVWQTGTGVPNDGKRDVPDLALNASPEHDSYLFCSEDGPKNTIIATCTTGFRTGSGGDLTVVGGTSAAAPTFAAITALLSQYLVTNGFQTTPGLSNINSNLYYMAAGNPGALHDVTTGNNIVPCTSGTPNCPASLQYGFSAGPGYDQVTGLGSVDAHLLSVAWGDLSTPTSTSLSASASSIVAGGSVTFTATVTPSSATGAVTFFNGSTAIGTSTLAAGTATFTTTSLPAGTDSITATYIGVNASSTSPASTLAVAGPFTLSANPSSVNGAAGQPAISTITVTPASASPGMTVNFSSTSCAGLPANGSCAFNPTSVNGASPQNVQLTISTPANTPPGVLPITVTGTASGTSTASESTVVNLTVTATTESFTIAPTTGSATFSVAAGATIPISITVSSNTGFVNPGSNTTALPLTFTCTGLPSESTANFSPGGGSCSGASSDSATSITMNIVTTAPTAQARPPLEREGRLFYAMLLPGIFGIVLAKGSRTRGARLLGLIVVLGFSTLWLGSCSGASGGGQKNAGTTPGTYAVVVNATTGGANPLTASFTVNLTVTP